MSPQIRFWTLHVLLAVCFGVVLPYAKGLDFFDPAILGAYVCLGVVFAAPAAAEFAESSAQAARGRIVRSVAYGEAVSLSMTGLGVATVYVTHRNRAFFPPALDALGEAAVLGLLLTVALSTLAVWMTIRWSIQSSKLLLRLVFLALLLWFYRYGRAAGGFVLASVAALGVAVLAWVGVRVALVRRGTA